MDTDMCNMKKTKKIILDLSDVCCVSGMHSLLKNAFSFPEHYGANWDAFHDCLGDVACEPLEIHIKGIEHLGSMLRNDTNTMLDVMCDIAAEKRGVRVVLDLSDGTERELR